MLFFVSCSVVSANQTLDSIVINRNHQLSEYYRFKDGMKERTWTNLVNLNNKALQVIETDNLILDNYLKHEMNRVSETKDQLEKANLEILLLNREIEVNSIMLEEQRFINSNLIIITGIAILLFIVVLILFIDRQIRFRTTRMELESFWARHDDPPVSRIKNKEIAEQEKQIKTLTRENEAIRMQLEEIGNQKKAQDDQLQKEIDSRHEIEKEIKLLIAQIKEQA
jgi:hypothetical protein